LVKYQIRIIQNWAQFILSLPFVKCSIKAAEFDIHVSINGSWMFPLYNAVMSHHWKENNRRLWHVTSRRARAARDTGGPLGVVIRHCGDTGCVVHRQQRRLAILSLMKRTHNRTHVDRFWSKRFKQRRPTQRTPREVRVIVTFWRGVTGDTERRIRMQMRVVITLSSPRADTHSASWPPHTGQGLKRRGGKIGLISIRTVELQLL